MPRRQRPLRQSQTVRARPALVIRFRMAEEVAPVMRGVAPAQGEI
jgi:hypothetical protein